MSNGTLVPVVPQRDIERALADEGFAAALVRQLQRAGSPQGLFELAQAATAVGRVGIAQAATAAVAVTFPEEVLYDIDVQVWPSRAGGFERYADVGQEGLHTVLTRKRAFVMPKRADTGTNLLSHGLEWNAKMFDEAFFDLLVIAWEEQEATGTPQRPLDRLTRDVAGMMMASAEQSARFLDSVLEEGYNGEWLRSLEGGDITGLVPANQIAIGAVLAALGSPYEGMDETLKDLAWSVDSLIEGDPFLFQEATDSGAMARDYLLGLTVSKYGHPPRHDAEDLGLEGETRVEGAGGSVLLGSISIAASLAVLGLIARLR